MLIRVNKKQLLVGSIILISLLIPSSGFSNSTKVLFSPNGDCQQAIVDEIDKATKSVDIAMYYLTSREIGQALVKAKENGVIVRVFLDQSQETSQYSKSRYLMKRGIEVRYYVGSGIMHNKFAIIDGKTLITGSFNWTANAEKENQENLLIMTDEDLIKQYSDRFEYLWKNGRKGELSEGGSEE